MVNGLPFFPYSFLPSFLSPKCTPLLLFRGLGIIRPLTSNCSMLAPSGWPFRGNKHRRRWLYQMTGWDHDRIIAQGMDMDTRCNKNNHNNWTPREPTRKDSGPLSSFFVAVTFDLICQIAWNYYYSWIISIPALLPLARTAFVFPEGKKEVEVRRVGAHLKDLSWNWGYLQKNTMNIYWYTLFCNWIAKFRNKPFNLGESTRMEWK